MELSRLNLHPINAELSSWRSPGRAATGRHDGLAQAHSLEPFELGQCSVEVALKMTFSGSPRVSGGGKPGLPYLQIVKACSLCPK